jgi:hypothetical protein
LVYGQRSASSFGRVKTGVETKVSDGDNYLTQGYGQLPRPRHGLMTGVIDFDRSGKKDIWADRNRVRLACT